MQDNIKFTWNMTEKNFKRLKKDLRMKREVGDNTYGVFGAGRMFFDIFTLPYEDVDPIGDDEDRVGENLLRAYAFVAGKDTGYANFPDNTPYDFVNDDIELDNINAAGTFDEFKSSFEAEIIRCANKGKCCLNWNEWLTSTEYADIIEKYRFRNEG